MTSNRHASRQRALQALYELDLNLDSNAVRALDHLQGHFSPSVDGFTTRLVEGVAGKKNDLDKEIGQFAEHWKLGRMPTVDRNILRLGIFELQYCDDIPAVVTIDEMVELAKQFGSEDTPAFVNGVLDKVKGSLNCPSKAP